ncbi:aryl-alcohol dehydrogenase [NADP+] [Schizopora paradoxa]|uniref:Aryl-alcohol dehydrogenase [NADP+] n=1 Tax=Schizopora paradoxa TaxID=27342 RepID=A0A0H2RW67_9AGAM|nr:aryl-alcohol dehydrogenase [NADP+] [Schizopora paradoxa]
MTDFFKSAPEPPTRLGRYRVLSPHSSIRVSPLVLGGANIGDKWNAKFGDMNKESSFKLLDAYFDAGGNFIDTANVYQDGTSEMYIGEWAEKRGIRDQLVIASKYSTCHKVTDETIAVKANFGGNNVKSLYHSVEDSLKKLRTTYIDIFYVHWWDYDTSIEEVMNALHHLVSERKILYLGISDTPAWVVSQANQYAKDHGKTPFVIYQGLWNVMDRAFERDIIPMARSLGMAIAPFNVLAGGRLRSDAEEERRRNTGENGRTVYGPSWERTPEERKMSTALEKVANEVARAQGKQESSISVPAVAIAYVLHKTPYVFPIIGGRKIEHLMQNIEALTIALSEEQMKELESVLPFDPGFPHNLIIAKGDGSKMNAVLLSTGKFDRVPLVQPIRPVKEV